MRSVPDMFDVHKIRRRTSLIGGVCGQWAALEFILANIIWKMLSVDKSVGRILTGGLDMLPRLRMAINLGRELKVPKPVLAALIEARSTVQDHLIDKRNLVVHGMAWDFENDPNVYFESHRQGDRKPRAMSLDDVRQLETDINAVSLKVALACHECGFIPLEDDVLALMPASKIKQTILETPPSAGS